MKLALGLDVQTNAKGGKFMSIEDSRQGALVRKADVEVLWEPGNFQDDGAKRVHTMPPKRSLRPHRPARCCCCAHCRPPCCAPTGLSSRLR